MDHTERVTGPEAMAKIEAYESALFKALQLLGHARYVSDVERARDVIVKALKGTRYDRPIERRGNVQG